LAWRITHGARASSDELVALDLRVTTVFRREDDGWHLCLRHADRVTAPVQPEPEV
jgi:ketosteroid isomerase-like protein